MNIPLKTTLRQEDLDNLKVLLSLSDDKFKLFYENLPEHKQKYCQTLLQTYFYDILDYAFDVNEDIDPTIKELLKGL